MYVIINPSSIIGLLILSMAGYSSGGGCSYSASSGISATAKMEDKCEMTKLPSPAHFVLVHGASFGGWSWYKIRCLLESIGHKVSCPDLKSSVGNPANADTLFSFQDYNKPLDDLLVSLPKGEKVVLVGHSAGGLSVTEAIHNYPKKIQVAVFVGAVMLRNGFETEQDTKAAVPGLSKYGEVCDYGYGKGHDNPPTSSIIKKEAQRMILSQMSPLEDCTLAAMLLRPSPTRALNDAIFSNGKDCDKVSHVCIKTLHDNALPPENQDLMIERWPPSDVFTIDSDHCPMFSNPSQLFGLLVKIAAKYN